MRALFNPLAVRLLMKYRERMVRLVYHKHLEPDEAAALCARKAKLLADRRD